MLLTFLQWEDIDLATAIPLGILAISLIGGFSLFKLGLFAIKAQRRTRTKWAAASFFIQFGVIFLICSPLFLLGMSGAFDGEMGEIIPIIVTFILLALFIDLHIINMIHHIGLKHSLIVLIITFAPLVSSLVSLGFLIPRLLDAF